MPQPDVTENYIRIRQKDPGAFQEGSFRTITISASQGIKAVIGRLKGETSTTIQSYLFDKDRWTVERAQAWVREHKKSKADVQKSRTTSRPRDMVDLTADNQVPPERYRLFPWGEYETYEIGEDGKPQIVTYLVDEKSAESIVESFQKIGNDVMIDYEHANEDATGPHDGGRAAGWITGIEAIPGEGIFATGVRWTPTATKLLQDRDYRFHSPHFTYAGKERRVVALLDDALVNKPASVAMIPVAAKATDSSADTGGEPLTASMKGKNPMSDAILRALSAADEGEAIAAITTMKADATKKKTELDEAKSAAAKAEQALGESDTLIASVMEATGCDKRDALVGVCKAHKDNAAKAEELTTKVQEFQAAAEKSEKDALIKSARVGEDKRKWLEKQTLPVVKGYVEECCKTPEVPSTPQSTDAKPDDGGKPEAWFAEVHSDLDEDKLNAEWKAYQTWQKANPYRPNRDFTEPDAD